MYVQERPGGPGTQVPTMRRFLIAIASLALLPAIASAQRGGMGAGMARPAMAAPAPHVAMHASPSTATHVSSGTASHAFAGYPRFMRTRSGAIVARPSTHVNGTVRNNGSVGSGRSLLSQDIVPGLGFDYPHVAAIHPHGINNRNRPFVGTYFPFFYGGGYYMPLSSDDVEEAPTADAQQADTGEQEAVRTVYRDRPVGPSRDNVPAPQTAAEQEAEQYVFVRRDGTVFFAAAYAWENGTLRYITSEGLRHTVTADKLDLDATQQFNEQRGLTFRSPV